jgi:hypothetical protein
MRQDALVDGLHIERGASDPAGAAVPGDEPVARAAQSRVAEK